MKTKFTILILLISCIAYCQSNVQKRDPINQNDYELTLTKKNSTITISNYKTSTINENSLVLKTEADNCNQTNGIYLTLSNGEVLSFDNNKATCTETETKKYSLIGTIILTPELYKKLSQIEIIEFRFGKLKVPVEFKEKGENLRGLLNSTGN